MIGEKIQIVVDFIEPGDHVEQIVEELLLLFPKAQASIGLVEKKSIVQTELRLRKIESTYLSGLVKTIASKNLKFLLGRSLKGMNIPGGKDFYIFLNRGFLSDIFNSFRGKSVLYHVDSHIGVNPHYLAKKPLFFRTIFSELQKKAISQNQMAINHYLAEKFKGEVMPSFFSKTKIDSFDLNDGISIVGPKRISEAIFKRLRKRGYLGNIFINKKLKSRVLIDLEDHHFPRASFAVLAKEGVVWGRRSELRVKIFSDVSKATSLSEQFSQKDVDQLCKEVLGHLATNEERTKARRFALRNNLWTWKVKFRDFVSERT